MKNRYAKVFIVVVSFAVGMLGYAASRLYAWDEVDTDSAELVIEVDIPHLGAGNATSGSTRTFAGGRFSVETVAYLKGGTATGGVAQDSYSRDPNDTVFYYGNKCVTVDDGQNYILVVICKAEFNGAIPEITTYPWNQIHITTEDGSSISGLKVTDDVGSARFYAQATNANRSWKERSNKLMVYFFPEGYKKKTAASQRRFRVQPKPTIEKSVPSSADSENKGLTTITYSKGGLQYEEIFKKGKLIKKTARDKDGNLVSDEEY
ncbi:hypothetical protein ACFL1E_00925 [Candidatus Omnitrophota bacterium]